MNHINKIPKIQKIDKSSIVVNKENFHNPIESLNDRILQIRKRLTKLNERMNNITNS